MGGLASRCRGEPHAECVPEPDARVACIILDSSTMEDFLPSRVEGEACRDTRGTTKPRPSMARLPGRAASSTALPTSGPSMWMTMPFHSSHARKGATQRRRHRWPRHGSQDVSSRCIQPVPPHLLRGWHRDEQGPAAALIPCLLPHWAAVRAARGVGRWLDPLKLAFIPPHTTTPRELQAVFGHEPTRHR